MVDLPPTYANGCTHINLFIKRSACHYLTCISCACRYDPKCDRWTMTAPMLIRRKHLGVAVLENVIYAAGGRDETSELDSVERYSKLVI